MGIEETTRFFVDGIRRDSGLEMVSADRYRRLQDHQVERAALMKRANEITVEAYRAASSR
jgi:hypothetical protein